VDLPVINHKGETDIAKNRALSIKKGPINQKESPIGNERHRAITFI
jgi:hypothetical protein